MNYNNRFWVDSPKNLFSFEINTPAQILNTITLLSVLVSIILSISMNSTKFLYIEIFIVGFIAIIYYFGFYNSENFSPRPSTIHNPFMNVPLEEYDTPQIYSGYTKDEKTKNEIQSNWSKGLFQDPNGRLFNRNNSQREYISQPIDTVPNDQGTFAYWLYGKKPYEVCKAGSIWDRYGLPYTQESLTCTGYNVSSPTNMGHAMLHSQK